MFRYQEVSPGHWVALVATSFLSGMLSLLGSSTIFMIMVRQREEKLQKFHNRLLLGMSSMDMLSTSGLGVSTLFLLQHPSKAYWYEMNGICTIQGAFFTLGLAGPIYNACLCLHYLAVIKYNIKEETLEAYEKYVHGISLGLPIILSVFGAALDLFHPSMKGICWLSGGCELDKSNDECKARSEMLLSAYKYTIYIIVGLTFLLVLFSMGSLYCFIRGQTMKMRRNYTSLGRRNSIVGSEEKRGAQEETLIQAYLYIAAFLCVYTFPLVSQIIKSKPPYFIKLLRAIFSPLFGLYNFIIYVRPRMVLVKQRNEGMSFLKRLKEVILPSHQGEERVQSKSSKVESRLSMIRRQTHDQNDNNFQLNMGTNESKDEQLSLGSLEDAERIQVDLCMTSSDHRSRDTSVSPALLRMVSNQLQEVHASVQKNLDLDSWTV